CSIRADDNAVDSAEDASVASLAHFGEEVGCRQSACLKREARLKPALSAAAAGLGEVATEGRRRRWVSRCALATRDRFARRAPHHVEAHLRRNAEWPAKREGVDQWLFAQPEPGAAAIVAYIEGVRWELCRPKESIGQGARAE